MGLAIFLIILILVIVLIVANIKITSQAEAWVIERLGAYHQTWQTGLHVKIPFLDNIIRRVSLKEQTLDFPPQPVITKDNVTIRIDTIIYFQITDPKLYCYGIEHPIQAIENITSTTLRNIIGELDLDETLTSRDIINSKIRAIVDEATDPWGIKVNRVEVKSIEPPREIQDSMEKQMKAERERRAKILEAEGNKKSQILLAEGEKEATLLRAEAEKQSRIKSAEGEAAAIIAVQQAEAEAMEILNRSKPCPEVLQLKQYDTWCEIANGTASKLILPNDMSSLVSNIAGITEIGKEIITKPPKSSTVERNVKTQRKPHTKKDISSKAEQLTL